MQAKPEKSGGYPWDKWFAKTRFVLVRGSDFNCQPHSMMVQIRTAASSRGKSVSIKSEGDGKLRVTVSNAA